MNRALLWKEWRQLKTPRWGLATVPALLPVLLIAAAEAAVRGWLPFGSVRGYTTTGIVMDVMPPLLAVIWSVGALMMTAQAMVGERAAGTEPFVLHRPVAPGLAWRARVLAVLGSALVVMVAGSALWLLWVLLAAEPRGGDWARAAWSLAAWGPGGALAAACAGLAAGPMVKTPSQAGLVGLVLAPIPVIFSVLLGAGFPVAEFQRVPVGLILPLLLYPFYVVASYRGSCRGEPAGRGRVARTAVVLGAGLLVVAIAFPVVAPIAIGVTAGHVKRWGSVKPAPRGGYAVVDGGWGVDVTWVMRLDADHEPEWLHRFAPPSGPALWNPDGTRVAVETAGGPLGSVNYPGRIEIFDTESAEVVESVTPADLGGAEFFTPKFWNGDVLYVIAGRQERGAGGRPEFRADLVGFNLSDRSTHIVPLPQPARGHWTVLGPAKDEALRIAMPTDRWVLARRKGGKEQFLADDGVDPPAVVIHRVSIVPGGGPPVELARTDASPNQLAFLGSPSGRYTIFPGGDDRDGFAVLDIDENVRIVREAGSVLATGWLRQDVLVWVAREDGETRLYRGVIEPGAHLEVTATEVLPADVDRFSLIESPDHRRLLLRGTNKPAHENHGFKTVLHRVIRAAGGPSVEVPLLPDARPAWWRSAWADPTTLVWVTDDGLHFIPLPEEAR